MGKTIREQTEEQEHLILSERASFSDSSLGRDVDEEPCDLRTCYQRDRDRILHCKAFRRLKHKTQVFLDPRGDHYRTRLTHTLEVSQIARTIGRALRLNEDLVEAIALGHDLGHTPFGHAGERALNAISSTGFSHNEQSVRLVEVLENEGRGLNLTKEVRDGIRNHKLSGHPMTEEGKVIQLADKIAYLHHDMDDAIRAGIIREEDLPAQIRERLGGGTKERLDKLVHDVIENSLESGEIGMSTACRSDMMDLRLFMFDNVYTDPKAKGEESKIQTMIEGLFHYYRSNPSEMPEEYRKRAMSGKNGLEVSVCDYISGMSDQFAIDMFETIFIPRSWRY